MVIKGNDLFHIGTVANFYRILVKDFVEYTIYCKILVQYGKKILTNFGFHL